MSDPKMMKNNLPLWVIGVSLSIILILMPLQEAYAFHLDDTTVTRVSATSITVDSTEINCDLNAGNTADWVLTGAGAVVPTVVTLSDAGNCVVTLTFADVGDTSSTPLVTYNTEAGSILRSGTGAVTIADDTAMTATVDGAPPIVSSAATTASRTIVLTMTEAMTENVNDPGDFTIAGVATNPTVTVLGVAGTSITLTLSASIVSTDTPTVDYNGEPGDLEDAAPAGNDLAGF